MAAIIDGIKPIVDFVKNLATFVMNLIENTVEFVGDGNLILVLLTICTSLFIIG